jgi:hypothetical protein
LALWFPTRLPLPIAIFARLDSLFRGQINSRFKIFAGGRPLRRRREMMLMPGSGRLRGTAALQACTETDGLLLADPLEPGGRPLRRRRETGVQFTAGHGCEGPQPSKPPPSIVATNGRPSLADSLEDVRSVGTVKRCKLLSRWTGKATTRLPRSDPLNKGLNRIPDRRSYIRFGFHMLGP